jgi:hypothetical protein
MFINRYYNVATMQFSMKGIMVRQLEYDPSLVATVG